MYWIKFFQAETVMQNKFFKRIQKAVFYPEQFLIAN